MKERQACIIAEENVCRVLDLRVIVDIIRGSVRQIEPPLEGCYIFPRGDTFTQLILLQTLCLYDAVDIPADHS